MSFTDDERSDLHSDASFFAKFAMKWIAIFAGFFIALGLIYALWIKPVFLDAQGRAERHSVQYVEGQRTFLLQKLSACEQLDTEIQTLEANSTDPTLLDGKRAQKKAFIREMRERVGLIGDKSAVPPEVTDYLSRN